MSIVGERLLLRIYLQGGDRAPGFERVIKLARAARLAGATVLKGIVGAGYHGPTQASRWSLADHLPVIIEIVDDAETIIAFVRDELDRIMIGGMLTLERAAVAMHRSDATTRPSLALAGPLDPLSTVPRLQPGSHMAIDETGVLLRIFIGESDRFEGMPLYEAIVRKARELGLAGATVLRGIEGFGAKSVVHRASLLAMSTDLPIVIEAVDAEAKIRLLLPHLEAMVGEGMITMEYVIILMYRHGPGDAAASTAPPLSPDAIGPE